MTPRRTLRIATLASILALSMPLVAQANTTASGLESVLQSAQTVGNARLKVWGFEVYDATLRADPGFTATAFDRHRFALELNYLRTFKGADIAERSIDEMQAIEALTAEQATRWQQAMARLFPNVQKGDRITGLHLPGDAARFYLNGRLLGDISDPVFARRFFGIWLSPQTSQPRMREQLLGLAGRTP
jgi:Chalcone isomerase-like